MARFDVGEVLTGSLRTAFRNLGPFFGTQGLPLLAMAVVSVAFGIYSTELLFETIARAIRTEDFGAMLGAFAPLLVGGLLLGLVSIFVNAAAAGIGMNVADEIVAGRPAPRLGEAWARFRARFGNYIGTSVLIFLAILGVMLPAFVMLAVGFIALLAGLADPSSPDSSAIAGAMALFLLGFLLMVAGIIVGFVLFLRWAVALAVSVFERRSVSENLRRSSELTKGSRGAILGLILLIFLIVGVPAAILGSIVGAAAPQPEFQAGDDVATYFEQAQPSVALQVVQGVVSTASRLVGAFVGSCSSVLIYRRLLPTPPPDVPPGAMMDTPPPPVEPASPPT